MATASAPPSLIYGAFSFARFEGAESLSYSNDEIRKVFDILVENDIPVDTARAYADNELTLGRLDAVEKGVKIHTKIPGFSPGCGKREKILENFKASLEALKAKQVEVLYLHSPDPDPNTDLHETVDAIQEIYLSGGFKQWGFSNFSATEVEDAYNYAKSKGYVLPTIFSGNMSLFVRRPETELLPTLRRLGISYAAYSPIAGGFLLLTPEKFKERLTAEYSRWNTAYWVGRTYNAVFHKPEYLRALEEWDRIATDSGISKIELAYRWILFHSVLDGAKGDAVVFGASKFHQFEQTFKLLKEVKPLDEALVKRIDALWDIVKDVSPLDNYRAQFQK